MQFAVTGTDGTDSDALARRMAAREGHLKLGAEMRDRGEVLFGAAYLDDSGKMIGSLYVVDFPSRKEVEAWLEREPYVTGGVWKKIDIRPCRVGPIFERA